MKLQNPKKLDRKRKKNPNGKFEKIKSPMKFAEYGCIKGIRKEKRNINKSNLV